MPSVINCTTTNGIAVSGDNSGSLQLATNNGTTAVTINTSQNVGIGTASPGVKLDVYGTIRSVVSGGTPILYLNNGTTQHSINNTSGALTFFNDGTERMRISSSGHVTVGKTAIDSATAGCLFLATGEGVFAVPNAEPLTLNRISSDGLLVSLRQDNTQEGNISVSGTTVSYNGGHLSRWSQLLDNSKDDTILKGTVLSNLDDMCVWEKDGTVLDNEQLNKMKVSDVEGDTNVAGVFVNWTRDEDCNSDDMNVAMTGDMIIRIANGVVVAKGDLLMSAGDGTAKPQGDDIVRSKTIAKVTSNHVTCTYADGSYCVPCVLMAC